jgi:hypothetical protein
MKKEDINPVVIFKRKAESLMDKSVKKVQRGLFIYTITWRILFYYPIKGVNLNKGNSSSTDIKGLWFFRIREIIKHHRLSKINLSVPSKRYHNLRTTEKKNICGIRNSDVD